MPDRVEVWYEGWGERWLWGTLATTTALTRRPLIFFEYSQQALEKGFELSAHTLALKGEKLRRNFPEHQLGLPGPVYDSLPDGWGMLLMDRLFRQRGLNAARIGPLERLSWIGSNAMGAMSFVPVQDELAVPQSDIPLTQLADEVREVLEGEGGAFLHRLLQMGGSPQGARPKALLYRDAATMRFTTVPVKDYEPWLIKFPARGEHAEVCAIEKVYAHCLQECGIDTPQTEYFDLPGGHAAFASKRFDRESGMRVPMQSLAAFTGADYRVPGSLDYATFLRATQVCTNDVREKARAFARIVFNVIFNNRDDHPKNFAYLMSADGTWTLAPAFDVTWNEGPGGYHQMDIMGEALSIQKQHLIWLGTQEAELSETQVRELISRIADVGSRFSAYAEALLPGKITPATRRAIQTQIDANINPLR
ncbi:MULTISPECIES: type II toxin-antitoxin system HipA family toxin [unclassified Leclercia]|uniref:Type II toxin-antitoxin system HipA family toxin n=1 Tax=Leclercia barmai TaxID=2785629 RepID=A0ABS7RUY1_9ENTR|nr:MULTISPECIES: type II toxin-antitoxin system HipA family toxin [unclassified Leclercia]MBZ0057199.1 type II toxin-antitoxin system HipA family toxin [Leclercia sp. EMC7]MCM5695373.1 type II toxin-antitoxin system HipA family toxin [Leclercia sp. LTM01]MCM5699780.1 type II toxin-antitoxin system HipA family toxin [Leclercia sp. LTM14]